MEIITADDLNKIEEWSSAPGRKLLFYHNDPDGICSAALWMKAFPDFEPMAREGPVMEQGFVRWIADQDPSTVVFVDLPVDQEWKKMRWLEKQVKDLNIIVIDHHIPEKDITTPRTIHVNNKLVDISKDRYLPASMIVYDMLESVGRAGKPVKWIAGIGVIGDYGHKSNQDFFKGMKSRMRKMDKASQMISAAVTLKGRKGADRVLKILLREKELEGFLERKTLKLWTDYVDREIGETLKDFRKNKEHVPGLKLIFFRMRSRLNIVSTISTIVSEKHPQSVIIIYKQNPRGMWKASLRMQSGKRDLGTLAKEAVRGMGSGGGHRNAAGARFDNWVLFRKRVIDALKSRPSA